MGDLAIVNMETNSDLLLFHKLETMLGEALHTLIVVQQCCHDHSIDHVERFDNQHRLATLLVDT
jgi:hypothetical protein